MKLLSKIIENLKISSVIEERIVINQPIEKIWKEFQVVKNYSKWNALFALEKFPSNVGEHISLRLHGEKRDFVLTPKVVELKPFYLAWEGKLYVHGLFNGRHQFTFKALDAQSTLFIQSEQFIGILVPIFRKLIIYPTQIKFRKVNYAFKSYIEKLSE